MMNAQYFKQGFKKYATDTADLKIIFRIIQSVPSKKAEPIKQWLAQTQNAIGLTKMQKLQKQAKI